MSQVDKLLLFVALLSLLGCSGKPEPIEYDSDAGVDDKVDLTSIAALKQRCSSTLQEITGEVYIEGWVLSSDDNGNIRNQLYITDSTSVAELRIDLDNIYVSFPYGSKVIISCNSLHLQFINRVMCIGSKDGYFVSSIESDNIPIYLDALSAPPLFIRHNVSISELDVALLGYYVKIEGVQFKDDELELLWVESGLTTKRALEDAVGNSLNVTTSANSNFAHYEIPNGSGSIGGILTFKDDEYQLVITNFQDVKLRDSRF